MGAQRPFFCVELDFQVFRRIGMQDQHVAPVLCAMEFVADGEKGVIGQGDSKKSRTSVRRNRLYSSRSPSDAYLAWSDAAECVSGTEAKASPALENAIQTSHNRVSQTNFFNACSSVGLPVFLL